MAQTCPDGTWRRVTLLIRITKMVQDMPEGFVESAELKVYIPFCGTAQLIKVVDLIISKTAQTGPCFKQDGAGAIAVTDDTRSWYAPISTIPSYLARETHNFAIRILNVQYGSWQGEFIGLKSPGYRLYFRSALEMASLIVTAGILPRSTKRRRQKVGEKTTEAYQKYSCALLPKL